jgi:hypothetical protein
MRTFLLAACAVILICSCKKESTTISLSGIYTEQLPTPGRSQITFIDDKLLVKSEPSNNYRDTFYYNIKDNYITWTHKTLPNAEVKLQFKQLDGNSFKIEYLYVKIPENPITFMTYKK